MISGGREASEGNRGASGLRQVEGQDEVEYIA